MGREIRLVPANWEHPVTYRPNGQMGFQPMHDSDYKSASKEWMADFMAWEAEGKTETEGCEYWDYNGGPPNKDYYRTWSQEDACWYQAWETVSEGTPVSPPFETKDELIAYLAENGDFWDQKRCKEPSWKELWGGEYGVSAWGLERAKAFVNSEWAPSFVVQNGKMMSGTEFLVSED